MATASTYTKGFHPNYVGIAAVVVVILLLLGAAIYLLRRFASRNARPS